VRIATTLLDRLPTTGHERRQPRAREEISAIGIEIAHGSPTSMVVPCTPVLMSTDASTSSRCVWTTTPCLVSIRQ
jgi:hypothetical protein